MWRIRHECLFIIVIQSSTQGGRRCKLITVVSWNDLSSHLKSTVSSRPKRYFNPTLAWWWGETTDVINLSTEWETTTGRDSRRSGEEKGIGQVIRLLIFSAASSHREHRNQKVTWCFFHFLLSVWAVHAMCYPAVEWLFTATAILASLLWLALKTRNRIPQK